MYDGAVVSFSKKRNRAANTEDGVAWWLSEMSRPGELAANF